MNKDGPTVVPSTIDLYHFIEPIFPQDRFMTLSRFHKVSGGFGSDQKVAENAIHPWDGFEFPNHEGSIGIEPNDKTQKFVRRCGMSKGYWHDHESFAFFPIQY